MNYLFAFFELGGGDVFNIALRASSNFSGAIVRRSRFRGFVFRFFTNTFPSPSRQGRMMLNQPIKLTRQPVPLHALAVAGTDRIFHQPAFLAMHSAWNSCFSGAAAVKKWDISKIRNFARPALCRQTRILHAAVKDSFVGKFYSVT